MKNILLLIFLFFVNCGEIKLISYNIRYENPNEKINSWKTRESYVTSFLSDENPDFIGLQEVTYSQLRDLVKSLFNHNYIGVGLSLIHI